MSVRARPTNRFQDGPKGRQPGLIESDLGRAFTHTLTSSPSGVADRQRVMSILAAGWVGQNDMLERIFAAADTTINSTAVDDRFG